MAKSKQKRRKLARTKGDNKHGAVIYSMCHKESHSRRDWFAAQVNMAVSEEVRARIVLERGRGLTWPAIAALLGINKRTAMRWHARVAEGGSLRR